MDRKKIIAFIAVIVVSIVFFLFFNQKNQRKEKKIDYISDQKGEVKLRDIKNYFRKVDFNDENTKVIFSEKVINRHTIKFFKSLQVKFKELDFQAHLDAIRDHLFSTLPHDEAEKLFALYEKFVKYEKDMSGRIQSWGIPKSPEHMLEMLSKIQKSQNDFFGSDVAESLFGAEIKAKEFPIRRRMIINNSELYGAEKEEKIKQLNKDMWGDESESVGSHKTDYDRYREKLDIYSKDLKELSEEEKQKTIHRYREEMFTPAAVKKMDEVDRFIKSEEQSEKNYREQEQKILSDLDMNEDEKKKAVKELQEKCFGKDGAIRWQKRQLLKKSTR